MAVNIALLRSSFEQVKPIANEAIAYFYNYMFEKYPAAKTFFSNTDMQKQHKALINSLVWVVDNLENTEALVTNLKKMGARHVKYGVQEEHYPIVGASLLATFAHFFGNAWTRELESSWTAAYQFIANTMIEGARETQDVKATAQSMAKKILTKAFEEVLRSPEFQQELRKTARQVLQQAVEDEAARTLSQDDSKMRAA